MEPLFGPARDLLIPEYYSSQAFLDPRRRTDDTALIVGFARAAQCLADEVAVGRQGPDPLVWPIVFCYRHYVELALKDLVRTLVDFDFVAAVEKPLREHRLPELWNIVRQACERLAVLDERIRELDERDPRSFAFRYATTKGGASSQPPGEIYINIKRFRDGMDEVSFILDGLLLGAQEGFQAYARARWREQRGMSAPGGERYPSAVSDRLGIGD
jgi:hypothetical protein